MKVELVLPDCTGCGKRWCSGSLQCKTDTAMVMCTLSMEPENCAEVLMETVQKCSWRPPYNAVA